MSLFCVQCFYEPITGVDLRKMIILYLCLTVVCTFPDRLVSNHCAYICYDLAFDSRLAVTPTVTPSAVTSFRCLQFINSTKVLVNNI